MPPALKSLVSLIFICITGICNCQVIDISNLGHGKEHIFANKYTSYLKFSTLVSFDSARSEFEKAEASGLPDKEIIFKGYDPSFYWFRFILLNTGTAPKDVILMQGGLGIRDSELWQGKGDNYIPIGKTGYKYRFDKRPYRNVHHCFLISASPNSIDTFYLNVDESHAYKVFGFVLADPKTFKKRETTFYFLFGNMIGLLILFIFINLYLYIAIAEKIHLWYSAYLLFTLLFLIKNEGLDAEFLGLDSELGFRSTSMGSISAIAIGLMIQVVQLFLVNINKKSFLNRLLTVIKWSGWISGIIYWFVFYIQPAHIIEVVVFQWANKTIVATLLVVPIACIYSFVKGYKPALFILTGMALLLIGGILRALFVPLASHLFPPTIFEWGMVMEAIIISFGLMYRYNQFKRDKENLKKELELQQKEAVIQVLLAQETEQKRIAADLHDELGGNLAAIKMTLQSYSLPERQSSELNDLIDKASVNARNISHNLMPPDFADTSLKNLLENHYRHLNAENNIRFYFHYTGSNHHFNKQEELMIYRIIMELSNNILKHSKATESTIQFIYHGDHLALVVEDNGRGFYNDAADGIGLKSIQSRVRYLNGSMDIDSGNNGTTVIIDIPYKQTL